MKQLNSDKTSSAQTVASIDDLLLEIFLRLRLKSLIRFKSVSKHWKSLISDPKLHFSRDHEPNPAVGIICPANIAGCFAYVVPLDESTDPVFLRFPKAVNRPITILHCCNGLLVCGDIDEPNKLERYFVLNPTTMKCTTLPEPQYKTQELWKRTHAMCLAFDPSKSPHYKVVSLLLSTGGWNRRYQFEVYSSQTGSWKICTEPIVGRLEFKNGVYWNGAVHWINFNYRYGDSIYFNPDDEAHRMTYKVMPKPALPALLDSGYTYYFGESCGHLHYIDHALRMDLTVYEMKRDYSEWFVKYRVDVNGSFSTCTLVRGKKDEECFLVLWEMGRTIRYNLVCKTFETLHDLTYPCSQVPWPYIESLCSV